MIQFDYNRLVPMPSTLLPDCVFSTLPDYRELANRERNERIRYLKTVIPHNPAFERDSLIKMREHKWLREVNTALVNPKETSLDSFLVKLLDGADTVCEEVNLKEPMPLVGLDLETFCLSTRFRVEGGELIHTNPIVGVCLAVTRNGVEYGYYLPVNHYATPECPNFKMDEVRVFLEAINKRCFTVLHNSRFDREVMSMHKIRLTHNYADTMYLAIAVGIRTETKVSVGLKELSKGELGREMVELKQIMGTKDFIPLVKFEARSISEYGCADAINTLALFNLFVRTDKYENPFKTQKLAMKIDQKGIDVSRSMLRFGQPIDYEASVLLLKTLIRRSLILEEKFNELTDNAVSIGSSEQVGTWLGNVLEREFSKKFFNADTTPSKREETLAKFRKKLAKDFSIEFKEKKLKAGTKCVYNSPDQVLTNLQYIDETYDWFPKKIAEDLSTVCVIVSDYRTVQHDYGIIVKFVKYSRSDDFGVCRNGIELKYMGTITTRFSNGKGKGDHDTVFIKDGKRGYTSSYFQGNGVAGFNAQGIPSTPYLLKKAKKIVRIPDGIKQDVTLLDKEVEDIFRDMILGA